MVSLSLLEGKHLKRRSFLGSQSILWGSSAPGWPPTLAGACLVLAGCSECTGAHQGHPGTHPPNTPPLSNHLAETELLQSWGEAMGCREMASSPQWEQQPSLSLHPLHCPAEGITSTKSKIVPNCPVFPLPQPELFRALLPPGFWGSARTKACPTFSPPWDDHVPAAGSTGVNALKFPFSRPT